MGWLEDYVNSGGKSFNSVMNLNNVTAQPSRAQVGQEVLNAMVGKNFNFNLSAAPANSSSKSNNGKGRSFVGKLLDALSSFSYASADAHLQRIQDVKANHGSLTEADRIAMIPGLDLLSGIAGFGGADAGKEIGAYAKGFFKGGIQGDKNYQHTGKDVINAAYDSVANSDHAGANAARGLGGLGLDVFTDPTSYIGLGLFTKAAKGLGLGVKAAEAAKAGEAASAVKDAASAAKDVPRSPFVVDSTGSTVRQGEGSTRPFVFGPNGNVDEQLQLPGVEGRQYFQPKPGDTVPKPTPGPKNPSQFFTQPSLFGPAQEVFPGMEHLGAKAGEAAPTIPPVGSLEVPPQASLFNTRGDKLIPNINALPKKPAQEILAKIPEVAKPEPIVKPVPVEIPTAGAKPKRVKVTVDPAVLDEYLGSRSAFRIQNAETAGVPGATHIEIVGNTGRRIGFVMLEDIKKALATGKLPDNLKGTKLRITTPQGKVHNFKAEEFVKIQREKFLAPKTVAENPEIAKPAELTQAETQQAVAHAAAGQPEAVAVQATGAPKPTAASPKEMDLASSISQNRINEIKQSGPGNKFPKRHAVYNAPKQANSFNEAVRSSEAYLQDVKNFKNPGIAQAFKTKFNEVVNILATHEAQMESAGYKAIGFNGKVGPTVRLSELLRVLGPERAAPLFAKSGNRLLPSTLVRTVAERLAGQATPDLAKLPEAIRKAVEAGELDAPAQAATMRAVAEETSKAQQAFDSAMSAAAEFDAQASLFDSIGNMKDLPKATAAIAEGLGTTPVGTQLAEDLAKTALEDIKAADPAFEAASSQAKAAETQIPAQRAEKTAAAGAQSVDKSTKILGDETLTADLKTAAAVGDPSMAQRVEEAVAGSFLSKLLPSWSQKDVRWIFNEKRSVFQANTVRFGRALGEIRNIAGAEEAAASFARWRKGLPVVDETDQSIRDAFQNVMSDMLNIRYKKGISEYSSLYRSDVSLDEMNTAMRQKGGGKYQFTTTPVDPKTGRLLNIPWQESWKYMDIQDPFDFLFRMRAATDGILLERTMWSTIANQLGRKAGPGVSVSGIRGLEGFVFDADHAEQIKRLANEVEQLKKPNNKFENFVDTVMSKWKSGVTIYLPSHHIRNFIGDVFNAWLAGVNNPASYAIANRVLRANHGAYKDIFTVNDLIDPMARDALQAGIESGKQIPSGQSIAARLRFKTGKTAQVSDDQLYQLAHHHGILLPASIIEDVGHSKTGGASFDFMRKLDQKIPDRVQQPFNGAIDQKARAISEYREHSVRLAHFQNKLEKYAKVSGSLDEAATRAAKDVRKWHPDGLDLTPFERTYMRRVFPFYSWTRKEIPLLLESVIMRPAKITAYPKMMMGIQQTFGIQSMSFSDPFPGDQAFPDWIRDMPVGPLFRDSNHKYWMMNPSNPAMDVATQFGNHPLQGIGSFLNPALRIPAEVLTGKEINNQSPIKDWTQYIDKQIPGVSVVNRLTNKDLGAGTVQSLASGDPNAMMGPAPTKNTPHLTANIINLLTAAGLLDVSQPSYIKSAQFDQRARVAAARKAAQKAAGIQ